MTAEFSNFAKSSDRKDLDELPISIQRSNVNKYIPSNESLFNIFKRGFLSKFLRTDPLSYAVNTNSNTNISTNLNTFTIATNKQSEFPFLANSFQQDERLQNFDPSFSSLNQNKYANNLSLTNYSNSQWRKIQQLIQDEEEKIDREQQEPHNSCQSASSSLKQQQIEKGEEGREVICDSESSIEQDITNQKILSQIILQMNTQNNSQQSKTINKIRNQDDEISLRNNSSQILPINNFVQPKNVEIKHCPHTRIDEEKQFPGSHSNSRLIFQSNKNINLTTQQCISQKENRTEILEQGVNQRDKEVSSNEIHSQIKSSAPSSPPILIFSEEDHLKAILIFKKSLNHQLSFAIFGIFMTVILYFEVILRYFWPIISFFLMIKSFMSFKGYKKKKNNITSEEKKNHFFKIFEIGLISLTLIILFFIIEILKYSTLIITLYTPFVHVIWWSYRSKSSYINKYVELILRVFSVLQIIHLSIQYDNIQNWAWMTTFLPTWILLSSFGFYSLGLTILLIKSIQHYRRGQTDKYQVKGIGLCVLISIVYTCGSFFFTLGLISKFESGSLKLFRLSSLAIIVESGITIFYCLINKKDLIVFIVLVNSNNLLNGPHKVQFSSERKIEVGQATRNEQQRVIEIQQATVEGNSNKQKDEEKKIGIKKYYISHDLPQFLMRFSSTYFRQVEIKNEDYKENKQQQQEQEQEQQQQQEQQQKQQLKESTHQKDTGLKQQENHINSIDSKESKISIIAQKLCLICFDKISDCVILQCGHGGLCYECGVEIWKNTGECYLCRQSISKLTQIDVRNNGKFQQILAVGELLKTKEDLNSKKGMEKVERKEFQEEEQNQTQKKDNITFQQELKQIEGTQYKEIQINELKIFAEFNHSINRKKGDQGAQQINLDEDSPDFIYNRATNFQNAHKQIDIPISMVIKSSKIQIASSVEELKIKNLQIKEKNGLIIFEEES